MKPYFIRDRIKELKNYEKSIFLYFLLLISCSEFDSKYRHWIQNDLLFDIESKKLIDQWAIYQKHLEK